MVRFEVSIDHGVTWHLFQKLALRGQVRGAPHVPSVFYATHRWHTVIYPMDRLLGVRWGIQMIIDDDDLQWSVKAVNDLWLLIMMVYNDR